MTILLCCAILSLTGCDKVRDRFSGPKTAFDGQAALGYVKAHLAFGPRTPGTPAHERAGDWIVERTNAWLHNFRRLVTRYENKLEHYRAFLYAACMLITLRQF